MLSKSLKKTATALCALAAAGFAIPASLSAQDDISITMWALQDANYQDFLNQAAAAFQEVNPGITVNIELHPNEAYKTLIQVALVGSDPPDVFFNWIGEDSTRLVRDGLALDIGDLGAGEGMFRNLLSESWVDVFRVDDGIYGVPTNAVTKYFYYNTAFFDEHGLSEPATFNELLGLCRQIREIDPSIVPMPLGNSERWKLNHFITVLNERVLGIDSLRDDYALTAADEDLFTEEGYVTAWEKVLELQGAGCFQDAPNATSPEVSRSLFSSEISPMIFCGSWCANIFDSDGFTGYALFRFPPVEGGASDGNSNMVVPEGLQIAAASPHPEAAVAWASWLVTPEMAAKRAEMTRTLVSNPALLDTIDVTDQFEWMAEDMASLDRQFNVIDVELEGSVAEAYLDAGVEILNGTMTPEQAMEAIRAAALAAKAAQ